jgi:hypothetical protein
MRSFFSGIALLCLLAAPCPARIAPAPYSTDINVAHIDDLGTPFDLKANLCLPAGATRPVPLPPPP